mgnify:CR=1 FL=1
MILKINKELFQWEKNRYIFIELEENDPEIFYIQFYNKQSKYGPEIPVENGKAKIPNFLLKEDLPIIALACTKIDENIQVIKRREFKVLKRAKPEYYFDDEDTSKEIIYDGGMEI